MSDTFSYSKIETYKKCPFKYKLIYVDKHQIKSGTVATDFGSLVHYIEERIGIDLKEGKDVNYDVYKDMFLNMNTEDAVGINILKQRYTNEWDDIDKQGFSYEDKSRIYLETGIYRLQNYLKENPNLSIYALEMPFQVTIRNKAFGGFIDRIFYDNANKVYIIEDIKTYTKNLTNKELKESLQMYIYTMALKELIGPDTVVDCFYNLPLMNVRQRSIVDKKLVYESLGETFEGISVEKFYPVQTPLCHWCVFSKTYPNQPEEAKNLCPYFCHWTKENKSMKVENYWQGENMHPVILEGFVKSQLEKIDK